MKHHIILVTLVLVLGFTQVSQAYAYVHVLRPEASQNQDSEPEGWADWIDYPEWIGF